MAVAAIPFPTEPAQDSLGEIRGREEIVAETSDGVAAMGENLVASHREEPGRVGHAGVVVCAGA